jgi:hypothetical protein
LVGDGAETVVGEVELVRAVIVAEPGDDFQAVSVQFMIDSLGRRTFSSSV